MRDIRTANGAKSRSVRQDEPGRTLAGVLSLRFGQGMLARRTRRSSSVTLAAVDDTRDGFKNMRWESTRVSSTIVIVGDSGIDIIG
jgi:hypothetical protein